MPSNARNLANLLGAGEATISAEKLGNDVPPGTEDYSSVDSLGVGTTIGETAFVEGSNRLYIWNGSGWYNIALINTTPTWDSGGQPAGAYVLDADSPQDATVITLAASDPEGIPISYNYITSGSMDSIATISQDSSVFTITPKTSVQAPDGGTGSITFRATDGINILPQVSSFTLNFISIIENSKYTTLLATATDTSDNNNITDASSNNHPITVAGDTHAGTFSPYRSRGYSTYFEDTAANVLYASPSSDFAFGTGAFTISVWVKLLHQYLGTIFDTNDGSNPGVMISVNNTTFYTYSNTWLSSTSTSSQDVWQHFCWTRDGSGNNKVFVNGTQATTFTDSTNYTSQNFKMGEEQDGTNDLKAYVKDLHIVKGYAYEPDSTYADGAAEPTTGTVFLGCSLPYHGDKSSSPKTLTVANSGISIVNDTPHDYEEYSATDHGGSVYFDGTTDYIEHQGTFTLPTGTNANWTIECWVNLDQVNLNQGILRVSSTAANGNNDDIYFSEQGGYLNAACKGGGIASTTTNYKMYANTWHHIAMVKNSGTVYLYNNGVYCGSVSDSNDYSGNYYVYGGLYYSSSYCIAGYLSDFKISNSAIYTTGTSNFTPPTAPLSSSGTALHIKGTDASIIDKAQRANLKLVGNTTGSTTQVKFVGTKSMYFDGNDYITTDPSAFHFGTGNYTIEFWYYANNLSSQHTMCDLRSNGTNGYYPLITQQSSVMKYYVNTAFIITGTTTLNAAQWYHVSVVRNNGTTTLFLNGSAEGNTWSDSTDFPLSATAVIGSNANNTTGVNGYLQDFRVTKDLARYTANFTPPTTPLEG